MCRTSELTRLLIYQAVIPVILNNQVEYLEEDDSFVVKVIGQEVDHDMRVN
jgi:hypothetical protein